MQGELAALESKINAILPPRYVGCFEDIPAASMGSASLKYDKDGRVAWGEIWTTFCHLALAGGPPHRGSFLAAVPAAEAAAHPAEQAAVVAEIKRAIRLSANLQALATNPLETEAPGWVCLRCHDADMAAWLVRAIVTENVIARHEGEILFVPAGPHFRIEKEIKNVVVSVAKTCHYLLDHVEPEKRPRGFTDDLIEPPLPEAIAAAPEQHLSATAILRATVTRQSGIEPTDSKSPGWIGLNCSSEEMAIWLQRAIVVENILARREAETLFVPVSINRVNGEASERVSTAVRHAVRLWQFRESGKS